jgi:hypothetical protein
MFSLGVASDEACITYETLDKYAVLFHNPLSSVQIKALAALFGWSLPAELSDAGTTPAGQEA